VLDGLTKILFYGDKGSYFACSALPAVDCRLYCDRLTYFETRVLQPLAELFDGAGELMADGDGDCFLCDRMWRGG
jgi:hypothetical protein